MSPPIVSKPAFQATSSQVSRDRTSGTKPHPKNKLFCISCSIVVHNYSAASEWHCSCHKSQSDAAQARSRCQLELCGRNCSVHRLLEAAASFIPVCNKQAALHFIKLGLDVAVGRNSSTDGKLTDRSEQDMG